MRTKDELAKFAERQVVWVHTHIAPLSAEIAAYAAQTGRGQPPAARVYLRDVVAHADAIADETLASLVAGVVAGDGLTALAAKTAKRVAEITGKPLADDRQGVALGYLLLNMACVKTGAAEIVAKHGDRPNKVEGGVKVVVQYELIVAKQQFIEDAALFGRVGMPTFQKRAARPWAAQTEGGVKGQQGGMVHGAAKQMRGVTPETAPALYQAVNAAQAVRYKVNPVSAQVVQDYDAAKALAWLHAHYVAGGMDPAKALAKAKEDARL